MSQKLTSSKIGIVEFGNVQKLDPLTAADLMCIFQIHGLFSLVTDKKLTLQQTFFKSRICLAVAQYKTASTIPHCLTIYLFCSRGR